MLNKRTQICFISAAVALVVLYSVVSYLIHKKNDKDIKPLDLMLNAPQVIFGQADTSNETFGINSDDSGMALLLFSVASFRAYDYAHLQLSIEGLTNNYQAILVMISKENTQPQEIPLLQPTGHLQTNNLQFDSNWQGQVQQIGLRILPQDHLGLSLKTQNPVVIKKAVLKNNSYFENYFMLATYWLDYEPWTYRSINHLKANSKLPLYAQPLSFIVLWLLICFVIARFVFSFKINILFYLLPAWLFLEIINLQNTHAKVEWSQQMYGDGELVFPDDELYKLASQVKSLLNLDNDKTDKIKHQKVLIISSNKYQRLRLIYHMLPVNSSFLDIHIERDRQAFIQHGDYILSYDLENKMVVAQNGVIKFNNVDVKVIEVAKGENFVLMQVQK